MDKDVMVINAGRYVSISGKGNSIGFAPTRSTLRHVARWLGCAIAVFSISLAAEAQTVPSISITTPVTVPATYTIGSCPAGQVIIPPGLYAAGTCGIENYWPGQYLNLFNPPVTPACPNGYSLSSFSAMYAQPNSALYFEGWCTRLSTLTCPSNSQPTTDPIGATCTCDMGYWPDVAGTSCIQYNLSITLEIGSEVEPLKSLSFKTMVKGLDGTKGGIPVTLILDVQTTSGGHEHGESNVAVRPRGGLSGATVCPSSAPPNSVCATGVTSTQAPYIGEAWFTFTAPAPAGTHTITATCEQCVNKTATAKVDVKVDGLAPIPDSSFYTMNESNGSGGTKVIGATDNHSENHYLTPPAASILWGIAASYQMEAKFWQYKKRRRGGVFVPPLLHLNDASLKWGGVFDISGRWRPGHVEHRKGTVIDVRANADPTGTPNPGAVPPNDFIEFEKIALSYSGAKAGIHCKSDDGQYREPPLCIGTYDGSQDSNRHYHIRLKGAKE